ncbi:mechanosensitive ion channel [Endozoicomonas sp. SM1973]|uniref:Mechanosensitive ion channel n=1 Tax=Spartinivicinus marinus TaxID=2994442 RepID=A0A853IJA0_9GAMM|nr:mechanosensitive ion channel family protein [Spartinivicinus marinus]MCX4024623.1 mechanosensitive ion channel family protein [Spartinivicinus marinus]NYZ69477.1 mechanosensitive ion channel [Spartinivicinus marinus]
MMIQHCRLPQYLCIILLVVITQLGSAAEVGGLNNATKASSDSVEQLYESRPSTPQQVSGYVAPLDDQQARALLIKSLSTQATADAKKQNVLSGFQQKQRLKASLKRLHQQLNDARVIFYSLFLKASGDQGWSGVLWLAVIFLTMCAIGWVAEKLMGRKLHMLNQRISLQETHQWTTLLGYFSLRTLFDLISIGFFAAAGSLTAAIFFDLPNDMETTLFNYFFALINFRVIYVLSRALFAPYSKGIRPLPLHCNDARKFHHWVLLFTAIYVFGIYTSDLWFELGMPLELQRFLTVTCVGLSLASILLLFTWLNRKLIASLFSDQSASAEVVEQTTEENQPPPSQPHTSLPKQLISQAWPFLFTLWIALLWFVWAFNFFLDNEALYRRVDLAWWLTLLFPIADRLFHKLLTKIVTIKWLQSRSFPERSHHFIHVIQTGFRTLLFGTAIVALAEAWGFGALSIINTEVGQRIISAGLDILITLLIAYILWEIIHSTIERQLPEPPESDGTSLEGEGGGAGASRVETLLPLLRTFLLAIIVVSVIISILHSLGVQIGPLLAGAGVVGIAIGFGAQKLVQDIISGIFFLWDDAFRRGEYIEAGGLRGTVEHISVRSMRLRHHLGAVQTLPYSEIATVKNLSRDWITMKLELRLPYDTDIEKVRKIIKKVGQKMMDDDEMGPNMILPLKSQGVMRVEESALIIRMKFTCKPGEQWVIRREAYRRVKEALETNGIHFAHREVKVALPKELEEKLVGNQNNDSTTPITLQKAAAAAADSIIASDELKKQNRIDDEKADDLGSDEGSA